MLFKSQRRRHIDGPIFHKLVRWLRKTPYKGRLNNPNDRFGAPLDSNYVSGASFETNRSNELGVEDNLPVPRGAIVYREGWLALERQTFHVAICRYFA